jgi:hypothetical protein
MTTVPTKLSDGRVLSDEFIDARDDLLNFLHGE